MCVVAVTGALLTPASPTDQDLAARLMPPFWQAGGSLEHILGTDQLGRDLLSRIMVGARTTLAIGVATAALEALIGVPLGLTAGYFGGRLERVIMSLTDIQMGFPAALLIIFIVLVLGPGPVVLTVAMGINGWMIFTRLTRVTVRSLKTSGFVTASVVAGGSHRFIMRHHLMPHLRGPLLAVFLLEVPRMILAESVMSFIGLGVQPPTISWGLLIGGSRDLIAVAYWLSLFPGLAIVFTVVSLYLVSNDLAARRARL